MPHTTAAEPWYPVRRRIFLPVSFAVLIICVIVAACRPADIRSDALKAGMTSEQQASGRAMLKRLQESHRVDLWKKYARVQMTYADEFPTRVGRTLFMPWPQNLQRAQMEFLIGTDNVKLTFLEGANTGETWGMQNWAAYKKAPSGNVSFVKDSHIWFWLPTYEYFSQVVYRLSEAGILADMGEGYMNGRRHYRLFATWGSPEPSLEVDQYVLWIDSEAGLLDLMEYTIRDMGRMLTGKMYYGDYRTVQGIPFAFRQSAGDQYGGSDVVHQAAFESVLFLADPQTASFFPDPSRVGRKEDGLKW